MGGFKKLGTLLAGQPAREQGPWSYNSKELNSANSLNDQEPGLLLEVPGETLISAR